jgi:SAM-dependent methyltransferase
MEENAENNAAQYVHGHDVDEQERLAQLNRLTNDSFIDYLAIVPGESICNFGCGLGILESQIVARLKNVKITAMERHQEYFAAAKKRLAANPNVEIILGDVASNWFAEGTFNLAFCRYLLEHVKSPETIAREMIRITQPGGRVVVQENDMFVNQFDPEIAGFREVLDVFCNLQIQMGGDPYIGRKLYSLFDLAEIGEIKMAFAPEIYTTRQPESYRIWVGNFLHILQSAGEEMAARNLVADVTMKSVFAEMEARIQQPVGVALFYWNRLTAWKNPVKGN